MPKHITISEQKVKELSEVDNQKLNILTEEAFEKSIQKNTEKRNGNLSFFKLYKKEGKWHYETSYFIGLQWIRETELSVYIQSKLNDDATEADIVTMLFDALQEPENWNHLEGLYHIDFEKPSIPIEQKIDILSPFLIVQFLQVLRQIVRKGLKKSYYRVTRNLNARVKGKILMAQHIKTNLVQHKHTHTLCQYDEYGYNSDENKILKKAYLCAKNMLSKSSPHFEKLSPIINYIHPAFENISDTIQTDTIKFFKSNPLYKEYDTALHLAKILLKKFAYNITKTSDTMIPTPPFWIDMSQLFELYVLKHLKAAFPNKDEVRYHLVIQQREPDYLLNSGTNKMVIDAKYKQKYKEDSYDIEDIRQIAAYARMEGVYKKLDISTDTGKNIACLIIYPDIKGQTKLQPEALTSHRIKGYVDFYKIGIALPAVGSNKI